MLFRGDESITFFVIGVILAIFLWCKIQVDGALEMDRFRNPISEEEKK